METFAKETVRIIHDDKGLLPGRPGVSEADVVGVLRTALEKFYIPLRDK